MFCKNCGNNISETDKFCPNCGFLIKEQVTINKQESIEKNQKDEKKAGILCFLAYLIFFISFPIAWYFNKKPGLKSSFITYLPIFFYVIGAIIAIIAKLKYSKSKKVDICLGIYISIAVLVVIFIIGLFLYFTITCANGCGNI